METDNEICRNALWNVGAVFRLLSKAADRNPYSWNMGFYEYPDGSGYEGRFTKCGSCVQTTGICQHDLFDFRHRNCLRSNQLIYFSISLVQFMIAASIVQALGKCVKSVLHIAAI